MAFYANNKVVRISDKPDQYGADRKIGSKPPFPGIYKCQNCGFEDVINRECEKLAPCSNCNKGIVWKMIVKAEDK